VEDIDEILFEWKSLSRKHGISFAMLPSCHKAMKNERDGNIEAKMMLPKAQLKEEVAFSTFQQLCNELSLERCSVAEMLSTSVTERLPSLGMDTFIFRADMSQNPDTFSYSSSVGCDATQFMLLNSDVSTKESNRNHRSGNLSEVASSGEKARVLLAIECAIPGSVGVTCCTKVFNDYWQGLPPIAVLYDEIDAHVGGRAAVSVANMLLEQSRSCQVIAITHSPSVAAVADKHIVVEKIIEQTDAAVSSSDPVRAYAIDGTVRRKELARMASGDLASDEAEAFADALIREGLRRRNR
jgi:DNA repair protein RecN (Recombination protein N)